MIDLCSLAALHERNQSITQALHDAPHDMAADVALALVQGVLATPERAAQWLRGGTRGRGTATIDYFLSTVDQLHKRLTSA